MDVCCFDKTGTLTADNLELLGVVAPVIPGSLPPASATAGQAAGAADAVTAVTPIGEAGAAAVMVLGACHELVVMQGRPVGDPMEMAMFTTVGWRYHGIDVVGPSDARTAKARGLPSGTHRILQRYAFSSELRRMSVLTIASEGSSAQRPLSFLTKGAPEALESLFKVTPSFYRATYLHHMSRGHRVLALGHRAVDVSMGRQRSDLEKDLDFVGFALLDCPLKRDSCDVVTQLKASLHGVVMITGDGVLTAADVARRVGMMSRPPRETLVLAPSPATPGGLEWRSLRAGFDDEDRNEGSALSLTGATDPALSDIWKRAAGGEAVRIAFQSETVAAVATKFDLAVTGDGLSALGDLSSASPTGADRQVEAACAHVAVFARVAPVQKVRPCHPRVPPPG